MPTARADRTATKRGEPERSADGRFLIVGGRRWRARDPEIPAPLAQELTDALMDARRGVGAARRRPDPEAERAARAAVHLAKLALGERGEPWWRPTEPGLTIRARAAIETLARHRGPDRSICPSDAARAIGGRRWRDRMDLVRSAARALARDGKVELLQRGASLDPAIPWRGPIRIRVASPPHRDGQPNAERRAKIRTGVA